MIEGIDHIVIVVDDLEAAISDYGELGFTVVHGGRHSGINTHNALIAFADGCYLELIAFVGTAPAEPHWWYQTLQKGGGLSDFCVRSDQVEADAQAFRHAGTTIGAPFTMGRQRPDGYQLRWEVAVNEGEARGLVPFFIRDLTPRDERVPHQRVHRNGASAVTSLTLAVSELEPLREIYRKGLGLAGETVERQELKAAGVRFDLGRQQLHLVAPLESSGVAAERLRTRGPSPLEVKLAGANRGLLDPAKTHGARLVLG